VNAELRARVPELEARLAKESKESHTSSKPPSSDPLGRKRPRSQRRRSGKKPGGQVGHHGETLRLVATPDEVVEHRPAVCAGCQTPLDHTASVVLYERRQVRDLPPVRLVVQEHRALHLRCPSCEQVSAGQVPPAASSRAQYGRSMGHDCERWRSTWSSSNSFPTRGYASSSRTSWAPPFPWARSPGGCSRAHTRCGPSRKRSRRRSRRRSRVRRCCTATRPGGAKPGTLAWAQVSCTSWLTHYAIHAQRGSAATEAIGILPRFTGVSVHDGWKPSRHYTACRHALGAIHHRRELAFLEEEYRQAWAKELKALLLGMKAAVTQARTRGEQRLGDAERHAFLARSEEVLAAGLAANPPPLAPERQPGQRGRVKQSPARNLLERLWPGQREVLAFLDDFTIPFDNNDNNQAEQDLRMLKVQQKIAGSVRADSGSEAFARIRGSLSSMRKQGVAHLAALQTVFTGQPLYPALG
jgi:transposase